MRRFPGRVTLAQAQALAREGLITEIWNPASTNEQERTWTLRAHTSSGRKTVCDEHGTVLRYTKTEALTALNTHGLIPSADAIAWRTQLTKRRNITCAEAVFLKERHILRQYLVRRTTDQRAWTLTFNPGKRHKSLAHDLSRKPIRFHNERSAHMTAYLIGFDHALELAQ